jgi:hypothetical protein
MREPEYALEKARSRYAVRLSQPSRSSYLHRLNLHRFELPDRAEDLLLEDPHGVAAFEDRRVT